MGRTLQRQRVLWQQHKRKLQYEIMSRICKQLPFLDDVYTQHEQRFLGLLQKLLDIRKRLEHYRTTVLPLYCSTCASLGADVWCIVSVDAVGKGADAEKFRHAMCSINETKEAKNHCFNADAVLSGALRFLDIHINAMKLVHSQISHRKLVKFAFNRYELKVSNMKNRQDCKISPLRLERNEIKLQETRTALQAVTFDLYRVFAKYESERDTMLNSELEMVRQVMHRFYAQNAEATNFTISEEVDRGVVDARAELLFKTMMEKEAEQDALNLLPSNSVRTNSQLAPTFAADGAKHTSSFSPAVSTKLPAAPMSLYPDPSKEKQVSMPALDTGSNLEMNSVDEDELSEKLRTIQLSRPSIPPLKVSCFGR